VYIALRNESVVLQVTCSMYKHFGVVVIYINS